eukprot:scaffold79209_cov36-Cyclotella_meneghiniana.AAC.1
MAKDTALCFPFLTLADLREFDRMDLTRDSHISRQWVEIMNEFLVDNQLVLLSPQAGAAASVAA